MLHGRVIATRGTVVVYRITRETPAETATPRRVRSVEIEEALVGVELLLDVALVHAVEGAADALARAVVRRPPPSDLLVELEKRVSDARADLTGRRGALHGARGVHAQSRPRLLALLDHAVGDVEGVAHAHASPVHHAHARALAPLHGVLEDGQVALLDEINTIHRARLDGDVYVLLVIRPLLERPRASPVVLHHERVRRAVVTLPTPDARALVDENRALVAARIGPAKRR
mmetsp:Transcript_5591/g.23657  ORF Transcript_5591/g.23657 Transcript_5591/m.23657 type:complete len:231 (+) Transcript_5591:1174-1866(+)